MKNFKEFRNAKKNLRKRSVRGGGKQDDGPDTPKIQQVQGEKGCRLGGSTSYVLPEPRANQMAAGENAFGIERIDTPPPNM